MLLGAGWVAVWPGGWCPGAGGGGWDWERVDVVSPGRAAGILAWADGA